MLEVVLNDEVVWPALALALGVVLLFTLLWRRSHSLVVVTFGFGAQAVADTITLFAADGSTLLGATILTGLILTYALTRWASGREAALGLGVILATHFLTEANDPSIGVIESIANSPLWLFPAAAGVSLRFRAKARRRELEKVRLRERQLLARELHDSVAHHVSAIVIRAQAGRTLATTNPAAATDALEVIEDAASRTLGEMRTMVGALRGRDEAEMVPSRGLADIEQLANSHGDGPRVDMRLNGNLDGLGQSVESALYRLAQESITNARRHARHATGVSVEVHGDDDSVCLTVVDDGDPVGAGNRSAAGYGLVGMSERAKLLGGTFEAGPGPERGWKVTTVLPRTQLPS